MLSRELNRGQKEIETAQGNPVFTWAGIEYPCTVSVASADQALTIGGFQMHSDLTVIVRGSVLPDTGPKENQLITFDGRGYSISKIVVNHGGDLVTLICNDPATGA